MRVNTNLSSLISYNAMTKINSQMEKSIRKLSSGLRINSAADDAAGLAMSEKMTAQIRGTDQARRNAEDGISLLQTADGALGEIQSILQRMRELSVQAANDTLTYDDRSFIQLEIDELAAQIDNIANQTQFNKKKILNGDSAILWSASTSDIRAIVGATLLSRDAFGQIVNAEGNYKLTFDEIQAGRESVQKSNIMYLKHGTHEASVFINAASGIGKLSALNMVEGVWTLETRETPFGGVNYYMEGAQQAASASVGIESFDASNTPNIVAPGTYDIRLSDVVPMMADFDEALAAGVVEDVLRSSRALDIGNIYSNGSSGDDFDAVFDIDADATGTVSSSLTYRTDIGGVSSGTVTTDGITVSTAAGAVDIKTDDNNVNNLFTHYAVTETDRRDWMASDIVVNETYVAAGGATLDLNVDYQTAVNDTIVTTLTYRSADALSFTVSEVSASTVTTI
ncbi:MAG: flagellin, partial [Synergistaceae bacterium]|nr:flagellin [Synergistaceae bacterium]